MVEKNRKKLYAKTKRGSWGNIKPITRVIPNKKRETRTKLKNSLRSSKENLD